MRTKLAGKGVMVKPTKPRPDFPLFIHQSGGGQWCKKVRGRFHYFGKVADDPLGMEAEKRWMEVKDDLLAGRVPRVKSDGLTVSELCNRFLTAKEHLLNTREIVKRTWQDYFTICERMVRVFGKDRPVDDLGTDDFALLRRDFAKTRGPFTLSGDITRVRSVFNYGYDERLLENPMRYGQSFKRPTRKVLRCARESGVKRMFSREEILSFIDAAGPQMKAMLLLACNAGFGNGDIGNLPIKAVDLKTGWISFPRPKTGIPRRVPLWHCTVEAIENYLPTRSKPKDKSLAHLLFLTEKGNSWSKQAADNPIAKEFSKLQKQLGTFVKGRGFYSLRHVFQTIADGARDPVATRFIMGHAADANDMSDVYREGIDDERLQAVVDHVHGWLFNPHKPR